MFIFTGYGSAQWEYGGKQIGYGPVGAIGLQPRLAPDGQGGVYVVWTAYRDDRPGREIILCHFDTSGAALFGEGLLITNDSLDQSMPAISPDGFWGCYVLWTDHRDFPDGRGTLYAQRITYAGQMLWGQGVRMFYTPGYAPNDSPLRGTDIYWDSILGVVGVCKLDTGYQKSILIAQRLDGNGNRLWDSLGVVIHADSGTFGSYFRQPHLVKSENDFYCTWVNRVALDTVAIHIQKFDQNGIIYFGLTGRSVITDNEGGSGNDQDDRAIQLLPDCQGGVVVGWLYYDLSLGPTLRADRISPSGQSLWQVNGKKLLPEERSNRWALGLHAFGEDSIPSFLAVVLGGYQANYQIVDLAGDLLLGNSGDTLSEETFFASAEHLDTLYFMQRIDNYFFGSKKDVGGSEYWPNVPYIHGWIGNYEIMADRVGGMYIAFTLYRDFRTDWVYIQRIYPDGHFGGDTTTAAYESESLPLPENPFNLTIYPNPFNSSALISFDIHSPSQAKLKIYDVLGRTVDTVELGQLSVGSHSYLWDNQKPQLGIASGNYIISIEIGGQVETKPVVILK